MARRLLALALALCAGCAGTLPASTPPPCRDQYEACVEVCGRDAPATWTDGTYQGASPARDMDWSIPACTDGCREAAERCTDRVSGRPTGD